MKNLFLLLALPIFILGCDNNPQFLLTGDLKGFDDTNVFLLKREGKNFVKVDSVKIMNQKFEMSGFVEFPEMHYIQIDGKSGSKTFFLENSNISFKCDSGNISNAIIEGSETNNEYIVYNNSLEPFGKKLNNLMINYVLISPKKKIIIGEICMVPVK